MTDLKVTIDLAKYLQGYSGEGESLGDWFINHLVAHLRRDLRTNNKTEDAVQKRIIEIVDERLREVVDQVLTTRYFKTNCVGQRVSDKEFTFEELVADRAAEYLTEKVNKDGGTDYAYQREMQPRIDWLIRSMVDRVYDRNVRSQIDEAVKKARAEINDKVLSTIAERVKAVISKL